MYAYIVSMGVSFCLFDLVKLIHSMCQSLRKLFVESQMDYIYLHVSAVFAKRQLRVVINQASFSCVYRFFLPNQYSLLLGYEHTICEKHASSR